jgi:hypothetical protein
MLTNPADYINHYVEILKEEYDLNDLKIDYHGFVGFLMNLFGWTNFDIKQYYDYLFKEGFLATAEDNKNLYLHGSKNLYQINFATASKAYGNIIFDFSKLPARSSNVLKREVILPSSIQIMVDKYSYISTCGYRFFEEVKNGSLIYYCLVTDENDRQRIVTSASAMITVPFYGFEQYEIKTYQHNVPNYSYGTYNQYIITVVEGDQVYDLAASVKKSGISVYEPFEIKYIKAFENSLSKAIFLNQFSNTSLILESGNGYHGEWIPNSIIDFSVKLTKGSVCNSLARQKSVLKTPTARLINYDSSLEVLSEATFSFSTSTNVIIFDFYYANSGVDILNGLDLKNDIIKWVETRENLINKNDFYNIFRSFNKDFNIIFKKNNLVDNNFYLCKVIRDQYQNIMYTTNYTYPCIKYDDDALITNKTISVQYDVTSSLIVGRYYYKIVAVDKFFISKPSESISQVITTTDRSVILKWSPVENAEYYKVYGRSSSYSQYWIVSKTALDSNGLVYFVDLGQDGTLDSCYNNYSVIDQINFPVFDLDLEEEIELSNTSYTWVQDSNYVYHISNKTFWISPEKITYNDIELTEITTPRLDQLIVNSWVIIDRTLYIKLDSEFNQSSSSVLLTNNKSLSFFSPFIYKYNSFFDWFEGYYLNDNLIQYPIISLIDSNYSPSIFYYNLVYDYNLDQTNIYIKSHQNISEIGFQIKIAGIDLAYTELTYDLVNDYFKYTISGFISSETTIELVGSNEGEQRFTASTPLFQQVYLIRDQLVLSYYFDENDNKYITNIPVLSYDQETLDLTQYENRDYLFSQIFDFIVNSNISQNRMQSDSIQTRFLNTIYCDSYIHNLLLNQTYSSNLILPLNINIKIRYNTSDVDFSTHQSDIELLVADYLQTNATGINIKYYNSQLIDLIHSYNSSIISVTIDVYDSYGIPVNNGIETKTEDELLPTVTDKLQIVKYTSIYWWWNINNIVIELVV